MALTQVQLEETIASLNASIASGVRSATVGGQTVTYNTGQSLLAALAHYQGLLNAITGNVRRRQTYPIYTGRGYD